MIGIALLNQKKKRGVEWGEGNKKEKREREKKKWLRATEGFGYVNPLSNQPFNE